MTVGEEKNPPAFANVFKKVCPALEESLIHLQKNTLYDVEASSLKYPALSFSAPLPAYNDAYIYSSPYNNFISDDTSWTYIDHVFEEPFYYIGYATSALLLSNCF